MSWSARAQSEDEDRATAPVIFSTDDLAPAERFDSYREWMSAIGRVEVPSDRDRSRFSAVQTGTRIAELALMRERCSPMLIEIFRTRRHATALDHWILALQLSGRAATRQGDDVHEKCAGDLTVTSLGRGGDVSLLQSASDTLYLIVPRAALPDLGVALDRRDHRRLEGPLIEILKDHIRALGRLPGDFRGRELAALAEGTKALLRACLAGSEPRDVAAPLADDARRRRVVRFVRERLGDPRLSPADVCAGLKISRATLYRLFEDSGGVMRRVLEERLARAHDMLADPAERRRIYEVAADCGFSSAEEFARAFRRRFGCSPTDRRNAAAPRTDGAAPADAGGFSRWLSGDVPAGPAG